MKVIGHALGRVVILFPAEEIRPIRGTPLVDAIANVKERYGFLHVPDLSMPTAQLEQEGFQFSDGRLVCNGEELIIREFSLYNGAISVGSYDTSVADLFLEEFLMWARETFQVRPFVRAPQKIYTSQVTVCFAQPLSGMLKGFTEFSESLSESLTLYAGISGRSDLTRISFGVDQTAAGANNAGLFSLERRTQIPFEEEWYFSEAALPSGAHVQLLEELEASIIA